MLHPTVPASVEPQSNQPTGGILLWYKFAQNFILQERFVNVSMNYRTTRQFQAAAQFLDIEKDCNHGCCNTHQKCSTISPTQQVEAIFHTNNYTFNLKIGRTHIKNHTKCSPFLGESHIITVLCRLDDCKVYLVDELNSFMNCE